MKYWNKLNFSNDKCPFEPFESRPLSVHNDMICLGSFGTVQFKLSIFANGAQWSSHKSHISLPNFPTRLECTDPELQPRAPTAPTLVSPGCSVAAPTPPAATTTSQCNKQTTTMQYSPFLLSLDSVPFKMWTVTRRRGGYYRWVDVGRWRRSYGWGWVWGGGDVRGNWAVMLVSLFMVVCFDFVWRWGGEVRYVSLFYIKSCVGIHSKIQEYFFGQDIKKNTTRNNRTDIGNIFG